jgi:hypothetical protein
MRSLETRKKGWVSTVNTDEGGRKHFIACRGHLLFVVVPRLSSLVVHPRPSWSSLSWWWWSIVVVVCCGRRRIVVVVVEVVTLWSSWSSVVLLSLGGNLP